MRLAMAMAVVALAVALASPAAAQTISVTGGEGRVTITAAGFGLRTVLEPAFALNVDPQFAGLTLGPGCRFSGVPAFNPIGANFRYECTAGAGPAFGVTTGDDQDIVLKRNQGPNDSFDVTASLGAGPDLLMFAGLGLAGSNTVDGGSGADGISYALCTCPAGVTAGLGRDGLTGFESLTGSPGPDRLSGLPEGAVFEPSALPQLSGGSGDDTITTVNGIRDSVSCGPGNDHAIADRDDSVGFDCERVDRQAGAPVFGAGPSGVVGSASARFEFALVGANPPPGRFECALDGAAFVPCASPIELSGLGEGQRVFAVRYHPDGSDPGPAIERRWTVDTVAPSVVFDAAPAGEDNAAEAQIAFHASEEATFACSLDAGTLVDCSSPHPLAGLAAGPHSFSVAATDTAGNTSVPVSVTWVVGTAAPTAPQTPICAAGTEAAVAGDFRVVARAPDACFVPETVAGALAQVSRGLVTVNGIALTPAPGTRIIVAGGVRADGPVVVGLGSLLSFRLPSLDLDAATRTLEVAQAVLQAAGLDVLPELGVEFGPEDGGRTKVTLRVQLPDAAFQPLPGSIEGVTVEVSPTFTNDRGVTGAARLQVDEAYLFRKVKVTDVDLAYDFGSGVFDGSFGIALGRPVPGLAAPTLTGSLSLGPSSSGCGLRALGLQASNLNRHVGYGVFVQRIGGAFECLTLPRVGRATRLSANGGISFGPRISVGDFEAEAISVDGSVELTIPTGPAPFSLEMTGTSRIVDVPVTEQRVKYTAPAQLEIGGFMGFTLAGFQARLELRNSWATPDAFNLEALGQVSFFGLEASAEGVFSTTGYAVCLGRPDARFGFGKEWFEPLQSWSAGCDVGPFRVAAAAAQAGTRTLRIAPGRRLVIIAAKGAGTPPKIVLSGPGGRVVRTPADLGAVNTRQAMLAQDTEADTTYIALFAPPAGTWRLTTAAGSDPVTEVRTADGLPPVRVRATVRRGVLRWSAQGLTGGQRLQFAELGARGTGRLLLTTRRAQGRLGLRSDPSLGIRRRIEATVINSGVPRDRFVVARYTVARPAPVRRVRAIWLRGGTLTWRREPGAVAYTVAVTRPDRTTSTHTTTRPRLRLRLPGAVARVAIVAEDASGRTGPAGRATFR